MFITAPRDRYHSPWVASGGTLNPGLGSFLMPDRKKREKVVAEITLAHLTRIAVETGRPLTEEQAIDFLNQNGRAYAMWTRMMQAGEDYIKATLQQQRSPLVVTRPANSRRLAI
jgi:tRNA nucleotidyltransferase (CCA-adding enzyme)